MKKFYLIAIALLVTSLTAMAQVELGAAKWNIRDGQRVSVSKSIQLSFPEITGVGATSVISIDGHIIAEGETANDDNAFEELEASAGSAIEIVLTDIVEVQAGTKYTIEINAIRVDGVNYYDAANPVQITLRPGERILSWTFKIDEESVNKIKADEAAGDGTTGTYWKVVKADQRHWIYQSLKNDEIMLDATTPLPMTEGLLFNIGSEKMYVGDVVTKTYQEILAFNTNNLNMIIPDCKTGDVITINANRATKPNNTKFTCITAMNGSAKAIDGLESTSGLVDSLQLGSNYADFKFTVAQDGDVTLRFSNALVKSVVIEEALPIEDYTYSVKAVYKDGDNVKELKTLIPETVGQTNDLVKVSYSYWLTDEEGNLYTYGTKGTELSEKYFLTNDTTFYLNYTKTDITDVVFLSEGEDFYNEEDPERTVELVTSANAVIRSSNGKAAYTTADTKITTLPAGTYSFKAIVFDAGKTASFIQYIGVSDDTADDLLLTATATNWTEATETFTLDADTDIIWRKGGSSDKGLDIFVIYKSSADGVATINAAADEAAAAARKVVKNGQLLIETANGTFNAAGAQVK